MGGQNFYFSFFAFISVKHYLFCTIIEL